MTTPLPCDRCGAPILTYIGNTGDTVAHCLFWPRCNRSNPRPLSDEKRAEILAQHRHLLSPEDLQRLSPFASGKPVPPPPPPIEASPAPAPPPERERKAMVDAPQIPDVETLPDARHLAHAVFDPLWMDVGKLIWRETQDARALRGTNLRGYRQRARIVAYRWLADQMGLPEVDCHMGVMDLENCLRVVHVCQQANIEDIQTWVKDLGAKRAQASFR